MAERAGETIGPLSLARRGRDALEGLDRLGLQGARLLAMRLRGRLTMADLIEAHARRTPQAEVLIFEDKRHRVLLYR